MAGFTGLVEFRLHRRIATSESLDGEVIGLVISKAEVVLGTDEGVLDFLEMGNGNYEALVDGVSRIHSFTYMERYPLEAAIVDASKAAFLATMIEKGIYDYRKYDPVLPGLADMRLDDTVPVRLNRLRRNIPEAYYYWVLTSGLLK